MYSVNTPATRQTPSNSNPDSIVLTILSAFGTAVYLWVTVRALTVNRPLPPITRVEAVTYMLLNAFASSIWLLRSHTKLLLRVRTPLRSFARIHLPITITALGLVIVAAAENWSLPPIVTEVAAVGVATTVLTTVCLALIARATRGRVS
jgi:small-conductance mechanosensitive channel